LLIGYGLREYRRLLSKLRRFFDLTCSVFSVPLW